MTDPQAPPLAQYLPHLTPILAERITGFTLIGAALGSVRLTATPNPDNTITLAVFSYAQGVPPMRLTLTMTNPEIDPTPEGPVFSQEDPLNTDRGAHEWATDE